MPSACGYPDATNTGPPSSTTLTPVPSQLRSGPGWEWSDRLNAVHVTGANAVLDRLDVTGSIVIDAPNVNGVEPRIAAAADPTTVTSS